MARPKSEDKKQALLDAATAAFAQSGIAASTALIARKAGVAEGTLFRYFATKGTVAKLAMRQPFVLFKGLTFQ
ncbi:TetR/AcrR family transcriptional regulator, partial [Enterobacter kobei]|uniref:TetR/AcrR family transcriptional regulator n=1 Tax=Enterobacter kobei TaxID=208224 RepID=UPI001F151616